MSSNTSRSGLVPTPKRTRRVLRKKLGNNDDLPKKFEALPMALSLRPFGGIYNPFSKGCSVLCNHPAPAEVKKVINKCKQSLTVEGKNIHSLQNSSRPDNLTQEPDHATDNIPEDLFRRYTDTDSRPLTPTPTVTSIHTRTSAGSFLNNRRCITPELGKNDVIKRKKIILDLRKSHSQETLYWKPASDLSSGITDPEFKTRSAGANEDKKGRKQKSEDPRPKSSLAVTTTIPEEETVDDTKKSSQTCINEQDYGDEDIRRGKKRKKMKTVATTATTFHLSQDPETQVAALGPDSLNPSTRPSLIPNSVSLLPNHDKSEAEHVLLKGSFLTDEAFQTLKIKLNVDVIENTFDKYLNRAYREAYKFMPSKPSDQNDVSHELEKLHLICENMPRKFSKSATRFNVPLNLKSLERMSVWDYLSRYVWVSRQRKQIYKRIFLKYIKTPQGVAGPETRERQSKTGDNEIQFPLPEYRERVMNKQCLYQALEDVLEFYGTEKNIKRVLEILDYENLKEDDSKELTFRTWCGLVAFAERLALDDPNGTDSCDELERADFNSMESRLQNYKVPSDLRFIFDIVKNTHNVKQ
ncbi:uncharacterized protein LOC133331433 [Musca vetustissima]|uniref:uncharacterized protein LOC133331433 n=1 Tax=Musca vetustissima TaxID=27455 RepID=UPI002AB76FED|nr:uncharacterized protein LOC133331433 [Musca vetustissima]